MYRPCKELFEKAQLAVHSTDLAGVNWDQWLTTCGQSQAQEREGVGEVGWGGSGNNALGYGGQLEAIPGSFAFAVEQQFQASTSI